jgi:hypothetical protein
LADSKVCPNCKERNEAVRTYCWVCYQSLAAAAPRISSQSNPPPDIIKNAPLVPLALDGPLRALALLIILLLSTYLFLDGTLIHLSGKSRAVICLITGVGLMALGALKMSQKKIAVGRILFGFGFLFCGLMSFYLLLLLLCGGPR